MANWFTNKSYSGYSKIVQPAIDSNISNLYSVDEISDWDWVRGYVELVEVDGEKYVIQINEYENLFDKKRPLAFCYDLVEDMRDINEKNKITPLSVILFFSLISLISSTKSLSGRESVARVHANEYIKKGQANLIREAMMKGYVEMSHINLSICTECLHAEYEAQHTTERLVSGG